MSKSQRCKVQSLFTQYFHAGFTTFKPQSIGGFTLNKNQGYHNYFTFVDSSYFELTLLSTTTPLPRRLNVCIELIKILTVQYVLRSSWIVPLHCPPGPYYWKLQVAVVRMQYIPQISDPLLLNLPTWLFASFHSLSNHILSELKPVKCMRLKRFADVYSQRRECGDTGDWTQRRDVYVYFTIKWFS